MNKEDFNQKERWLLKLLYETELNKFSQLNSVLPFSRGTLYKYLLKLESEKILIKDVDQDRSVIWRCSSAAECLVESIELLENAEIKIEANLE